MGITRDVGAWIQGFTLAHVPPAVVERARACLLYNLSMGLAGVPAPGPLGALGARLHAHDAGPCTVFGGAHRHSPEQAAFMNAALITARSQNDTDAQSVTHPGCVIVPALLALGQSHPASARDALAALIVGYELIPRLARPVAQHCIARGYRTTSVFGAIGAAATAARLLRLDATQAAHAVALAANTAGGLLQHWADGSDEWQFQVAHASRCGVQAALLARDGIRGATHAFEGAKGFYQAYGDGHPPTLDWRGWMLPAIEFKPYPGCAFNQRAVHGLRQLLRDQAIAPAQVREIVVRMAPQDAAYPGVNAHGPFASTSAAIMSAPFMLAATLCDGAPTRGRFLAHDTADEVHALSQGIRVEPDAALVPWHCTLVVTLDDGQCHRVAMHQAVAFALNWQETVDLTRGLSQEWELPKDSNSLHARVCDAVAQFGASVDATALADACTSPSPAG